MKPKQPISAFFIFTNERRAALLAENKSVLEVAKITGEEWKNMTEEQKGPYEEVYFFLYLLYFAKATTNHKLKVYKQFFNFLHFFVCLEHADGKEEQGEVFARDGSLQTEEG